ncbi:hypothetical protein EVJ58_g471 [Rhodofomes roseus]|uniref:Uncharacterized protein n=1 Tax=Rhodofomes roseus TaxID=34475 RepID=A0A4Y9Z444_9APHY|nr:hypothetical protein EVJ58_g471 [Rhodofomes roseus]
MRCLVFFVWAINVVHLFLVVDSAYIYTVNYHSDPPALDRQTWSGMGILLVSTISDLGQKGIFSYRVWRLSRKWYLCAIICSRDICVRSIHYDQNARTIASAGT